MEPMAMAACIPWEPASPAAFRIRVENRSVAMAIPETGLLLLPTSPTIREDTVAKKNPNRMTRTAPSRLTGTTGNSHMNRIIAKIAEKMNFMLSSREVRSVLVFLEEESPLMESRKVDRISGRDLIRLMIPPAATAPAPM